MKRIISAFLVLVFMCSLSITSTANLGYGEEWNNYVKETTVSYTDVPDSHWAKDAIVACTEKNWFGGYPDKSFRPNGTITRAEALKVFVVFLGLELRDVTESYFYDVDASEWYAPYIEAGKDLFPKYTTIQGKTPFKPNDPVTREDTVYALVRALGLDVGQKFVDESVLNMFNDKDSISKGMGKYFTLALNNQLVGGYPDSTIRAQASLSRAEFATLLSRGVNIGRVVSPDPDDPKERDDTDPSDEGVELEPGEYSIKYQNVPEYANSAQSRFPTSYNSKDETTLGTPTWPGRDFDYWEVVEGKIVNNKIARGTTGNIVLKAHWINSENISIPSSGEVISCIQNPVDGCYYFTYKIGTITKIPVADKYTPKRAGNGVAVELETETTTEIATEYGNTIASSISAAVSTTESWKNTYNWAKSASLTNEVSANASFPVDAVNLSISRKVSTSVSSTLEIGHEAGGSTNNSYSETKSSSTTVVSKNKEIKAQTEYFKIPADYPDGYYSYRTTVDADVYAVVKYDTKDQSYYLSTYSVLGDTKESLFYEEAGVTRESGVNTKYNKLEYDVPTAEIENFFRSNRYTVELDYNDDSGKVDSLQVLVGEAVYLPTPKNSDGAFVGWEYNTNGSVKMYRGDTAEIFNARNGEKVTLKANWGTCEVSYNLGEGGGLLAAPLASTSYPGNNAKIVYNGSDFTYKFEITKNSDPYVTIGAEAYLEEGKTYYVHMNVADTAVNSNAVQLFYAIGGAYTEAASVRFGGDSTKTIKPTKTGYYNFRIDNDTGENITITELWVSDVDLTAKSVRFNGKYGTLPQPRREGYSFDGWYYNGKRVTKDSQVNLEEDHTLVAKWTPAVSTSGSYGYYSREIEIKEGSDKGKIENHNVGMNRNALIANGYTKLEISLSVHGYEKWLFLNPWPIIKIYDRKNAVIIDDNKSNGWSPSWEVRNYKYTVSIDALQDDGSIKIGFFAANESWLLGTVEMSVTAIK